MPVFSRLSMVAALLLCSQWVVAQDCDKACLESLADDYRRAYLAHDPSQVAVAAEVRFSENFVVMPFPDATWDTITEEVGPALTLSDPATGQIGIFTSIMQQDTMGFLVVRLKVEDRKITEIEHVISTARNISGPPTPIADTPQYEHDPLINQLVAPGERLDRAGMNAHAHGYFDTLQRNDGEIRGTCFAPGATRRENGRLYTEIEEGFLSGFYWFNDRVRRWPVLVDEERGVVLARGFIDHKGDLDEYALTDGTMQRSIYREPHSWGFLEMFAIRNDCIAAVVATFIGSPYYMQSPWDSSTGASPNYPR